MTEKIEQCKDAHCPIHGNLKTRGREFTGTVIESKAQKTATIEWQRRYYLPKYERHENRRTKIKAHNPECLNAKKGDIVTIKECKPLSKTKHFVIIEKTGQNIAYMAREELLQESKVKPRAEIHAEHNTKKNENDFFGAPPENQTFSERSSEHHKGEKAE